jgi:hypothetical protein
VSESRSAAFVHPAVDAFLMGGASLAAYAACVALAGRPATAALAAAAATGAAVVVNGAHFAATNYRLYRSAESARQFPLTAALVPLVVLAGAAASLRWPAEIAPSFLKLFLFWSPYHYSGQTVGLSQLYCRRAGVELSDPELKALRAFVYGTFAASAARADTGLSTRDYLGLSYPSLGLPAGVADVLTAVMAAAGLALLFLWARRLRAGRGVPALAWVPPLAQFVWFIPGPSSAEFYPLVPMFHGAQYLLVAWYLHLRERREETPKPAASFAAVESGRFAFWNILLNYVMFAGVPWITVKATGVSPLLAIPVMSAAVQLHHFFVDGVIWRLKRPRLARALAAS